jgi:hypothetical protein
VCREFEELRERLQVEKHEMVVAADKFAVLKTHIARVECRQMVVREDGIAFSAIPNHTDFCVTTAEFPKEFFNRLSKNQKRIMPLTNRLAGARLAGGGR